MTRHQTLFIITVIFWFSVAGVFLRVNRLWLGPVTLRWTNLTQPSATFRWNSAPLAGPLMLRQGQTRTFKVVVPRAFSTAELTVSPAPGAGQLMVVVPAPSGKTPVTQTRPAGAVLNLPLTWSGVAVQSRSFSVSLTSQGADVQLLDIRLRLQR